MNAEATDAHRAVAKSLLGGEHKAILLGNAVAHHEKAASLLSLANWIAQQTGASVGYLSEAAKAHQMFCISEVMDTKEVELVANYVDIVQIGARNMQNFSLLKAVGTLKKPVLLKRGMHATYSDFLMAAEYILMAGNRQVILCERGIRTFETYTRNTLDISAVPILQELSHLPVIVDPSHAVGIRRFVPALAYAAVAAGADGLLVEVHPEPDKALCDGQESLTPAEFANVSAQCLRLKAAFQP